MEIAVSLPGHQLGCVRLQRRLDQRGTYPVVGKALLVGTSVTLTVAITPATAAGSVTFYDGVTVLGSIAVAGGQAALSTSSWHPASIRFPPASRAGPGFASAPFPLSVLGLLRSLLSD